MHITDEVEPIEWEIALLICPKLHEKKMSIAKDCDIRNTYCPRCGKPTYWKRKPITSEGV